jgi:protein transport protein SEC13
MAAKTVTFETHHEEMIHDAQLDYYGKRLATASSDRSIRIFDVAFDRQTQIGYIPAAHDGPIWQVCWAHPKFGPLLASASYDGRAIVWKEMQQNQWVKVFETVKLEASSQPLHRHMGGGMAVWMPG